MGTDARVDDYIARAEPFAQPILTHLRALIHRAVPGVDETVKWGMPHFTLAGRNLAGIAGFKAHAALIIHHAEKAGDGMGAYGKIASLADLPPEAEIVAALQGGVKRLESGARTKSKAASPKPEIAMPDDFAAALPEPARAFFDGLAPSHRRDYLEWITEAKRAETRARRIAQAAEWLGEGKKRNWKYEDC